MSRACAECGCTEGLACLEFDGRGIAHACYWVATDLCSACAFSTWVEPPSFDEGVDTRARYKGKVINSPALAGLVARPRGVDAAQAELPRANPLLKGADGRVTFESIKAFMDRAAKR